MRISRSFRKRARRARGGWKVSATALLVGLLMMPSLFAQKGGGGGKSGGGSSSENSQDDDTSVPVCPQIVGQHPLLEKLTMQLHLSCQQEVRILPLMHDEEAVAKPLVVYGAFTPEERHAMVQQLELAARMKVRPFLLPEQQTKNDAEAASEAGKAPKKIGKKKTPQVSADAFASEEALSGALDVYSALTVAQKKDMILQVKQAARRDGSPVLTPEQTAKIDADIAFLRQ
jgi:hypothetical protein